MRACTCTPIKDWDNKDWHRKGCLLVKNVPFVSTHLEGTVVYKPSSTKWGG